MRSQPLRRSWVWDGDLFLTERRHGESGSNRGKQSSEVGETKHRDGMGSVRDVDNLSLASVNGALLGDVHRLT